MDEKTFYQELGKIRASRLNQITYAVNCKVPKKKLGLKSEVEEEYYNSLISQAETHVEKYGYWPTFEMDEIDYDDPVLDIYRDEVSNL